ncbi:MAG: membrane protein insertase YidC [Verrucomicrobia bacterium]|nr:membrane protein insertase YidC [Verrucomicrobiota bacterium]MBI3869887.1 membrane protein insertase YidC [Verrucomicrobiota bacterium]
MDRKAIIVITLSILLLFTWRPLIDRLYPPPPAPAVEAAASTNVNAGATQSPPSAALAATTSPAAAAPIALATNIPEQTLVLSNAVARYVFTSRGGGLKSMELLDYPETVARKKKAGASPVSSKHASLNSQALVPAMAVFGGPALEGDGVFQLTPIPGGVRAEKALPEGLALVKDFILGSNYLFRCNVRFENRTDAPRAIPGQEIVIGTATPMALVDDGTKVGFYWGRDKTVEHVTIAWFKNLTLACFPGTPRSVYQEGGSNVVWAAVHNQFFALAAIPQVAANQILGRQLSLPAPTVEELADTPAANRSPQAYQTSMLYPGLTIPPRQALERGFSLYGGPKEYNTLSRIGNQFKIDLDQIMGFDQVLFGSFSGFFAKILLLAMNGLHSLGIAYGWTIVAITVLMKILFWPLTQASTRSAKRMQALQPQMKALQDKFKDDPTKLNKKMMEFWKENKVSPFGGCLPVLLQMPVFIGFFAMIQTAIELRGASFLWAADLTQPDTLFVLNVGSFVLPVNPMPLLMGVVMLWQARLQPMAPGMDPMQANMMKYMPLIFLVGLYSFSSGLTLYWTVQNLLSVLQTKLTKTQDDKVPRKPATPGSPGPAQAKKRF